MVSMCCNGLAQQAWRPTMQGEGAIIGRGCQWWAGKNSCVLRSSKIVHGGWSAPRALMPLCLVVARAAVPGLRLGAAGKAQQQGAAPLAQAGVGGEAKEMPVFCMPSVPICGGATNPACALASAGGPILLHPGRECGVIEPALHRVRVRQGQLKQASIGIG